MSGCLACMYRRCFSDSYGIGCVLSVDEGADDLIGGDLSLTLEVLVPEVPVGATVQGSVSTGLIPIPVSAILTERLVERLGIEVVNLGDRRVVEPERSQARTIVDG